MVCILVFLCTSERRDVRFRLFGAWEALVDLHTLLACPAGHTNNSRCCIRSLMAPLASSGGGNIFAPPLTAPSSLCHPPTEPAAALRVFARHPALTVPGACRFSSSSVTFRGLRAPGGLLTCLSPPCRLY